MNTKDTNTSILNNCKTTKLFKPDNINMGKSQNFDFFTTNGFGKQGISLIFEQLKKPKNQKS